MAEAVALRGLHRRYSPQLKTIVRSLILQHKFSVAQIIAVIPVSKSSVRQWVQKKRKGRRSGEPQFKQIRVESSYRDTDESYLIKITVVLALLTLSQFLSLAYALFQW